MSRFYFFTDADMINNQSADDAFGPRASAGGLDKFLLTSIHKSVSAADLNAYAVCDGIIFAQENSENPDLLNIILKPLKQPPYVFPKIKFFIYRGVRKNSVLNGDRIGDASLSSLNASIWSSFNALNEGRSPAAGPDKNILGLDLNVYNYPDTLPLENVFFRENPAGQLPVVRAGWTLGKFSGMEFGFEIMTESIGFDPEIRKARSTKNMYEVPQLPAGATQPITFGHWHDKEYILNYVDPCAFFGMFYDDKVRVKGSGGSTDMLKGNDLYDSVISRFWNKNIVYLDIRNDFNWSFNYFRNYGTGIRLAKGTAGTFNTVNYYRSGWPVLALTSADLAAGDTGPSSVIRLQLPDGNGDNASPLVFVSSGCLSTSFPRDPKSEKRFVALTAASGWTTEISLAAFNRSGLSGTTPISSVLRLKYNRRIPESSPVTSSGTVIRSINYLDNLFAPFDLKLPYQGNFTRSFVYDEEQFTDTSEISGYDIVSSIGIAEDDSSVTLFSFPSEKNVNSRSLVKTNVFLTGERSHTTSGFLNILTGKFDKILAKDTLLLTPTATYPESQETFLRTGIEENTEYSFSDSGIDDFTIISFTKTEFENLKNLKASGFSGKYRIYLGVVNKETGTDNTGKAFTRSQLVLRGFENTGGTLQIKEVSTGLKIYSYGNF